jgi:hypothetical protein
MLFDPNFRIQEFPELWAEFIQITGSDRWKQRVAKLRQWTGQNFLSSLILHKYSLELTFDTLQKHRKNTGRHKLNASNLTEEEYVLYAFIAFTVRVYRQLSDKGRSRLKGMLTDGLQSDNGLASLQHEMLVAAQLMYRRFDVAFSDIEGSGGFDFLATRNKVEIEVECKVGGADKGRKIRVDELAILHKYLETIINDLRLKSVSKIIRVIVASRLGVNQPFLESIRDSVQECIRDGLSGKQTDEYKVEVSDFDYQSSEIYHRAEINPDYYSSERTDRFIREISNGRSPYATIDGSPTAAVVLTVESEKEDTVLQSIINDIKDSAKAQFSKTRPGAFFFKLPHLSTDDLEELIRKDKLVDPSEPAGLATMIKDLLSREDLRHIYAVAFLSGSLIERERKLLGFRQSHIPTRIFYSFSHPASTDPEYQIFNPP